MPSLIPILSMLPPGETQDFQIFLLWFLKSLVLSKLVEKQPAIVLPQLGCRAGWKPLSPPALPARVCVFVHTCVEDYGHQRLKIEIHCLCLCLCILFSEMISHCTWSSPFWLAERTSGSHLFPASHCWDTDASPCELLGSNSYPPASQGIGIADTCLLPGCLACLKSIVFSVYRILSPCR